MNKKGIFLGLASSLTVVLAAGGFFAANNGHIDALTRADNEPNNVTLTYEDFAFSKLDNRDFWVLSPNGNKLGFHLGGNYAIGGEEGHGELTLENDEGGYVDSREVNDDASVRKYKFSAISSINVSFTANSGFLKIQYFDGEFNVDGYLNSGSELNLNGSSFFKIYPTGRSTITSIKITYDSNASFC